MERLLAIYERYPLEELIVHPRVQTDFIRTGSIWRHLHGQRKTADIRSVIMVTLWTQRPRRNIREGFPSVDKFMIGRGLIKHPWLLEELSGGRQEKQEQKSGFPVSQCDPGGIPAADVRGTKIPYLR